MSTTRETKPIEVGAHKLTIKTYLTGREHNELERVYLAGTKAKMVNNEVVLDSFSPTIEEDSQMKAIELLVVDLDGDASDILNRVLDLPKNEYLRIVAELGEVTGKKKASA